MLTDQTRTEGSSRGHSCHGHRLKVFDQFLSSLSPSAAESDAAKAHRQSIYECLSAKFRIEGFFRTGSFGNGTSISGHSDVDYFAVIPSASSALGSKAVLVQHWLALVQRFSKTGAKLDPPAIRLPFGYDERESTEVVPAIYLGKTPLGDEMYGIPDGKGGWMRSAPGAHHAYLRALDERLGGRARALIRLVKAWKYFSKAPLSSFYIEAQTAAYASNRASIEFPRDLAGALRQLNDHGLRPVSDVTGVSSIAAYEKPEDAEPALKATRLAATFAKVAEVFVAKDDLAKAYQAWQALFRNQFPPFR